MNETNNFPLDFDKKLQICKMNNEKFDGRFYLAVKSTKIFCLPSCKAKFPLRKNILFCDTDIEAIELGYRPCKRCRPDKFPKNYPEWLDEIKYYLDRNQSTIDEKKLIRIAQADITTIRRYFKKYFGTTLRNYHKKIKMEKAWDSMGKSIPLHKISEESGYQTVKSFKSAFKKHYGFIPRDHDEFFKSGL